MSSTYCVSTNQEANAAQRNATMEDRKCTRPTVVTPLRFLRVRSVFVFSVWLSLLLLSPSSSRRVGLVTAFHVPTLTSSRKQSSCSSTKQQQQDRLFLIDTSSSPTKRRRYNNIPLISTKSHSWLSFPTKTTTTTSTRMTLSTRSDDHPDDDRTRSTTTGVRQVRTRLRRLTGFSLTAARRSWRAATGVSVTAVWATTTAVTGLWIRQAMRVVLSILPTWARYFVQPFLVAYYVPLFVLRSATNPQTRREARVQHDALIDGWKHAVQVADDTVSYWPIHLVEEKDQDSDDDKNNARRSGNRHGGRSSRNTPMFAKDMDELDMTDAISESVDICLGREEQEQQQKQQTETIVTTSSLK